MPLSEKHYYFESEQMAIIIRNPGFEKDLDRNAKVQSVPTTKGRLLRAIAQSALSVANAEGVHVGQIIDELNARASQKRARAAG